MRVPEFMFCVINPIMRFSLRSPIHGIFSKNIMLICYQGRKTGKYYEVPVRYIEKDGIIKCFTDKSAGWWPNLRDNSSVQLCLNGKNSHYKTVVVTSPQEKMVEEELTSYLKDFPHDAVYHDVRLDHDQKPSPGDLEEAAKHTVMVIAKPQDPQEHDSVD